jgi:hypothetical protein
MKNLHTKQTEIESRARARAHAYFDRVWQSGLMSRKEAYIQMRVWMTHKNNKKNHIRLLSVRQCHKLVKVLRKTYPDLYKDMTFLENDLFYP